MSAPVMYEGAEGVLYLKTMAEHHVTDLVLGADSVAVSAAAGTGWRYDVVLTVLPRPIAGGEFVVTVLNPFTAAYSLGDPYPVDAEKVRERFVPDEFDSPQHVAAVTATINYALQKLRDHYLPKEEKK